MTSSDLGSNGAEIAGPGLVVRLVPHLGRCEPPGAGSCREKELGRGGGDPAGHCGRRPGNREHCIERFWGSCADHAGSLHSLQNS
ncbi:uncharacterized protein LOC141580079 isoform X3 [Saimiri boliviensis]|uniref:uncharacterized protein LOC141580079 isoform X3 n=1 Tax=Saimiri boliviensis TaxID=27679 RepID=UPI003D776E21